MKSELGRGSFERGVAWAWKWRKGGEGFEIYEGGIQKCRKDGDFGQKR